MSQARSPGDTPAAALQVLRSIVPRAAAPYLACGAILIFVIILNRVLLSSVNLWILFTAPLEGSHFSNPIIGYSQLLQGAPIHIENQSPLYQSLTFNGVFTSPDSFFLRAVYPFLVSIGSWMLGLRGAALAINYISLGVFVASTFWLTRQFCNSLIAASFAAALAAFGTGSVVHLNDLSAHMLGFAVYAAATCLIFSSRVWESQQPLSVHVAIGVMLAIATLAYPSGFLLTLAYVLVAARYSKWLHVFAAATLGGLARFAWEHLMDFAYRSFFDFAPDSVNDFGAHTWWAVDFWLRLLLHDPAHLLLTAAQGLSDCLFTAFPLITLAGAAALVLLNRGSPARLWFFAVFFALPYVGAAFFSPVVGARGYLVYGSVFIVFAALPALIFNRSGLLATDFRRLCACSLALILQVAWSLAPYFGYYFPAVSYLLGFFHGMDPFTRVDVVNLAGDAPLWRYFDGNANFVDAGGLPLGSIDHGADRRSFGFALVCNAFMLGLAVAPIAGWVNCRPRFAGASRRTWSGARLSNLSTLRIWAWPAAWVGLSLALAVGGYLFQTQQFRAFSATRVSDLPGQQRLTLSVRLSPEASEKIRNALQINAGLESFIYLHGYRINHATFRLEGHPLPAEPVPTMHSEAFFWRLDNAALTEALNGRDTWLSADIAIEDGYLGGWQVIRNESRKVSPPLRAAAFFYWPSFEFRLFDPQRNTTVFIGY
ncbi:MAG: hypothetical protein JO328_04860 [Hyphomicrobiales bacterium]|nr:hypothetical protein [Hyphomicrobiales bacterium]MBV8825556.1 hypothetical protein [Hyphomicrobiales bacterium]MBV9430123.1 hypothetical protein [Bradyrhizobiaceae bacterium]